MRLSSQLHMNQDNNNLLSYGEVDIFIMLKQGKKICDDPTQDFSHFTPQAKKGMTLSLQNENCYEAHIPNIQYSYEGESHWRTKAQEK